MSTCANPQSPCEYLGWAVRRFTPIRLDSGLRYRLVLIAADSDNSDELCD